MNTSAGWFPDPLERHERRYWDGTAWTDHVADGTDQGIDRLAGGGTARDEAWAEQVEDAPNDATTILAAAPVVPATGVWRRFRGLPAVVQGATVALVAVVLLAATGDTGTEDLQTTGASTEATTTTTAARIVESTSAPATALPPTTIPPTTVPRPTTTAPPPPTTAAATMVAGRGCHSSYQGTCIPPNVSDADCAAGKGNGPWYVQEQDIQVVGPDVFDLDRDGDGVGCES